MYMYACVYMCAWTFYKIYFINICVDIGAHQPAAAPFPTRHSLAFIMVKVIVSLPGSRSATQLVS